MYLPSALALDLCGFGVYPFPPGAAGAMSFHDPLEGTETRLLLLLFALQPAHVGDKLIPPVKFIEEHTKTRETRREEENITWPGQ